MKVGSDVFLSQRLQQILGKTPEETTGLRRWRTDTDLCSDGQFTHHSGEEVTFNTASLLESVLQKDQLPMMKSLFKRNKCYRVVSVYSCSGSKGLAATGSSGSVHISTTRDPAVAPR